MRSVIDILDLSVAEVEKDIVLQAKLRESYHTKFYNYVNSVLMDGIDVESAAGGGEVWWVVALQVIIYGSTFFTLLFTALYLLSGRKRKGAAVNG